MYVSSRTLTGYIFALLLYTNLIIFNSIILFLEKLSEVWTVVLHMEVFSLFGKTVFLLLYAFYYSKSNSSLYIFRFFCMDPTPQLRKVKEADKFQMCISRHWYNHKALANPRCIYDNYSSIHLITKKLKRVALLI